MSESSPHFIRQWRLHRGLSLRGLEKLLTSDADGAPLITYASIGRIESGEQPFSEPILNALALALNVPRSWLLERDPAKEGQVIDLARQLSERDRERIIQMMQVMLKTG